MFSFSLLCVCVCYLLFINLYFLSLPFVVNKDVYFCSFCAYICYVFWIKRASRVSIEQTCDCIPLHRASFTCRAYQVYLKPVKSLIQQSIMKECQVRFRSYSPISTVWRSRVRGELCELFRRCYGFHLCWYTILITNPAIMNLLTLWSIAAVSF